MKHRAIAFAALVMLAIVASATPVYACSGLSHIPVVHGPKAKAKTNPATADKAPPKAESTKDKPATDASRAKDVKGTNGQKDTKSSDKVSAK